MWGVAAGRAETIKKHFGTVRGVAFSLDGSELASGSDGMTVRVWDVAAGRAGTLEGHISPVRNVAVSAEGSNLVSGFDDWKAQVWGHSCRASREHLAAVYRSTNQASWTERLTTPHS
jgi:WD40 repeat protein